MEPKFDDFDEWFAQQVKDKKADEDEYCIASAAWGAGWSAGYAEHENRTTED